MKICFYKTKAAYDLGLPQPGPGKLSSTFYRYAALAMGVDAQ